MAAAAHHSPVSAVTGDGTYEDKPNAGHDLETKDETSSGMSSGKKGWHCDESRWLSCHFRSQCGGCVQEEATEHSPLEIWLSCHERVYVDAT